MFIHRRAVLRHLVTLSAFAPMAVCAKTTAPFAAPQPAPAPTGPLWLSAGQLKGSGEDAIVVAGLRHQDTEPVSALAAGFRGHEVVTRPGRPHETVMFARRPGREALLADLRGGTSRLAYRLPEERQAFGHGCFSSDGSLLFAAEGNIASGEGFIVVRDANQDFREVAVWPSGGIGPHQILMMPDQRHMVVANGGLLTRPESGDQVLNLESTRPTLSYLDTRSGKVVETVDALHPRSSIRHIAVSAAGDVVAGMQFQRLPGEEDAPYPIAAVHRRGQPMIALNTPEMFHTAMKDYIGSVAVSPDGRRAACTSPRGNLALFWDLNSRELAGHLRLRDVCGLGHDPQSDSFVLTNSLGAGRVVDAETLRERRGQRFSVPSVRFDNHLTRVVLPVGVDPAVRS